MSDETLALILRLNLAVSAAVALALLLRWPARRLFGPRVAYGLWSLVPLSALAMLVPARVIAIPEAAPMAAAPMAMAPAAAAWAPAATQAPSAGPDLVAIALVLWLAGAVFAAARLVWRQARFARAERAGTAGPAAVGVIRPRVVLPGDFASRYSARERELVLAHEAAHLARHDTRVNAAAALLRCVAWFNPFAHALAHALRVDQELACDAAVVAARPSARKSYAEAMLKTQLTATPLPLGCYWPASGPHPLARRIALLARPAPAARVRILGTLCVGLTGLALGWSAWAARPPEFIWVSSPPMAAVLPSVAVKARPPAAAPARWTPTVAPLSVEIRPAPAPTPRAASDSAAPEDTAPPPQPLATPVSAAPPAEGCGQADRALIPKGDYGPVRRIHDAADWSAVEPGQAVRVYAATTDADGVALVTDLTSFGSQHAFRQGCIRRSPSPDSLYTSVIQQGDRYLVRLSIRRDGRWVAWGQGELASGEMRAIALDDGREVQVMVAARPETPEELDTARKADGERLAPRMPRWPRPA